MSSFHPLMTTAAAERNWMTSAVPERKGTVLSRVHFFDSRDLVRAGSHQQRRVYDFRDAGEKYREHLPGVTPSAMTRIFKRLKVHGLIEKIPGTYKYLITSLGKEIIAAGLTIKNLILVPALTS